ncbi:MAG: J domain-containing protein [Candidatus Bathyarchaeota archaeon]|nr:J domain-containing protein [Candidatus Bathyarchaeota archaeon]
MKERAMQILNLRYLIEVDVRSSYKTHAFENHPDRRPEINSASDALVYEQKIKVVNQAYELLIEVLNGVNIDLTKYAMLEDTDLVQSVLPKDVKPAPLGKTDQELWMERYGNLI